MPTVGEIVSENNVVRGVVEGEVNDVVGDC